jgi:hypothetical protein
MSVAMRKTGSTAQGRRSACTIVALSLGAKPEHDTGIGPSGGCERFDVLEHGRIDRLIEWTARNRFQVQFRRPCILVRWRRYTTHVVVEVLILCQTQVVENGSIT